MTAVLLSGVGAEAQSLFGNQSPYGAYREPDEALTFIRMLIMIVPASLGMRLGWFMSPQAAGIRGAITALSVTALFLMGIGSDGFLGWSSALVLGISGFFLALGYPSIPRDTTVHAARAPG